MNLSMSLVSQMPKTDLHCHFDGSVRIDTMIELAKRRRVKLFSYEKDVLMEHMKYGKIRQSLEEYLFGFEPIIAVLQDKEDIERAFFEICEDAAAENIWHLELRYCPLLLTRKGLPADEAVSSCVKAAERAERELGMSVKQILCGLKNTPRDQVMLIAKLAVEFKDQGVVGFDLAGPETGFPVANHQEAIDTARKNHLFVTMHAGESSGPENIAEAIHNAHAQRIGHATSLIKSEELLCYVINNRIGIESCPLSNLHTRSVNNLSEHPLKEYLERGVRVSINTDNRLCSDTSITKEILTISQQLNLNLGHIHRLLINGFKGAFLPYDVKRKLLDRFNSEWLRLVSAEISSPVLKTGAA